jgi:RNA-directed DNA polymerase
MNEADNIISKYALDNKIRYTRYADDLTFSGSFDHKECISYVRKILYKLNLKINENKLKIMTKGERQYVTGIVVNEKMNPLRSIRRNLRQECYYIKKYGLEGHARHNETAPIKIEKRLIGMANFILSISNNDRDAIQAHKLLIYKLE